MEIEAERFYAVENYPLNKPFFHLINTQTKSTSFIVEIT